MSDERVVCQQWKVFNKTRLKYGTMKGNKECVLELSKVNVGDFASYQHGAVLIEVIDKLSESEYLKIINQLDDKQKKAIYYSYIWAGLEFTPNPKYQKKHIEIAFPKLTKQLAKGLKTADEIRDCHTHIIKNTVYNG